MKPQDRAACERILKEKLGSELCCQLAEECSELAKAVLKLRRTESDLNPTPVTREDCERNITEELTDVALVSTVMGLTIDVELYDQKLTRWMERLGLK